MILADILQWFLIVVGALVTLNAYWLGAHALFPGLVTRAGERIAQRPLAATLIGLLIAVPVLLAVAVVAKELPHPLVQTLCVGLALLLGLLALTGSAGFAERLGRGLPAPVDAAQPWRRVLRGGIVLGLAYLMPFLGWFALLPWSLVAGLGALALAGRAPRAHAAQVPLASAQPSAAVDSNAAEGAGRS